MYLGVDIGASYCKSALIDTEERAVHYTRVPMPPFINIDTNSSAKETSMELITNTVLQSIKEIAKKTKERINAIGVAGQMHGILFVDNRKRPVSNFISWQDERATKTMPGKNISFLDYMSGRLSGFRSLTGTDLRPGMLGPILFWWAQSNLIDKNNWKAAFLSDYFVSMFTDSEIVCDPTQAAGSGVYDLRRKKWLQEFLDEAGLSESIMPEIVDSGTMAGKISNFFAGVSGISEGTPVYVSVGDYHAALFSSNLDRYSVSINVGTGAQVSLLTDEPVISGNFETRPFFDSCYTKTVSGLPGGRVFSLFRDFINDVVLLFAGHLPKKDVLAELDKLSCLRSGETSVFCNPFFYGVGKDADKAGFFRLNSKNFKITDCYEALINSIVDAYHNAFNVLNHGEDKAKIDSVILSGGVGQKSHFMMKMIERSFGLKVGIAQFREEAAVGAALLGAEYSGMDSTFKKTIMKYSQG